jgi:hypothetical protein
MYIMFAFHDIVEQGCKKSFVIECVVPAISAIHGYVVRDKARIGRGDEGTPAGIRFAHPSLRSFAHSGLRSWIPAYAGMTGWGGRNEGIPRLLTS